MFDPYHKWLGIPREQRPPTHYQLLGLSPHEQDSEVIEEAAIRQTAHVRTYQMGPHAAECTRLLNEIAQARTTLLNPVKRKEYDARIGQSETKRVAADAIQTTVRPADPFADIEETEIRPHRHTRPERRHPPLLARENGFLVGRKGLFVGVGAGALVVVLAVSAGALMLVLHWSRRAPAGPSTSPVTSLVSQGATRKTTPAPPVELAPKPPPMEVKPPVAAKPDEQASPLRQVAQLDGQVACFAPDSRRLLLAEGEHLHLLDLDRGQKIHSLLGHRNAILRVSIGPDGKRAASACADGSIKLWDLDTGKELHSLFGHGGPVLCVAFSPDGQTLFSGGDDRSIRVWEVKTGRHLHRLVGHSDKVWCVCPTPTGDRLFSGSDDRTVRQWDVATGKPLESLQWETIPGEVRSLSISADGRLLVYGSAGAGNLGVWDVATGKPVQRLATSGEEVTAVALSRDGKHCFTQARKGLPTLWEVESGRPVIQGRSLQHDRPADVGLSPDGRWAFVSVWPKRLQLYGLSPDVRPVSFAIAGDEVRNWRSGAYVQALVMFPEGRLALSTDSEVIVWDLEKGTRLRSLYASPKGGVIRGAAALSPDGQQAAAALLGQHLIRLWNGNTGAEQGTLEGHTAPITGLAYTPDGKTLLSSSDDQTVRVWDLEGRRTIRTLTGHRNPVLAVACSPEGKQVISAARDGTLRQHELDTGREVRSVSVGRGEVTVLAFAPDGRSALAVCSDPQNSVTVWDMKTLRLLYTLIPLGRTLNAAFTPDGRQVLTVGGAFHSVDRSSVQHHTIVRLWDLAAGMEVRRWNGHTHQIHALAFGPDGQRAVTAAPDGTMKVWQIR